MDNKVYILDEETIVDYIMKNYSGYFDNGSILEATEIGNGNINYVFRVKDKSSGKSIILKQAGDTAKISERLIISRDRGEREKDILKHYKKIIPSMVPDVYEYDKQFGIILMQDIKDHIVMREGLMQFIIYPEFAQQISTFLAETLILSSDLCMEHKDKILLVKQFMNPELCDITEKLVFTEPYQDTNFSIHSNVRLQCEVAKLKFKFMNDAQALIHGDLHTGSIFINEEHLYVFDPEFVFYGPMGYDIGNVIAHLLFAWCYSFCYSDTNPKAKIHAGWLLDTINQIINLLKEKILSVYDRNVNDYMAKVSGFIAEYIKNILSDAAGYAGTECIRRVVGLAKVDELTKMEDLKSRGKMETFMLKLGECLIMERESFQMGKEYVDLVKRLSNLL